jgi:hypothetical protein
VVALPPDLERRNAVAVLEVGGAPVSFVGEPEGFERTDRMLL